MDRKGHLAGAGLISISDGQPVLVLQRVAVLASGENRALPSGSASETNNECQIKFKLLQLIPSSAQSPLRLPGPYQRNKFRAVGNRPPSGQRQPGPLTRLKQQMTVVHRGLFRSLSNCMYSTEPFAGISFGRRASSARRCSITASARSRAIS